MKKNIKAIGITILVVFFLGCAGVQAGNVATLQVNPAKVPLSTAIFKTPVEFSGSGWAPGEVVSIEMVIPPDVKIPAIEPGQNAGIAFATADEKGNIKCKMGGMTKIITVFRGSLDPVTLKPIGKTFKPIPPGSYAIQASGMNSDVVGTTSIEFVKPIPKEKK